MKIAIDISPLSSGHSVRGQGFYLSRLKEALETHFTDNTYLFFKGQYPHPANFDILHYPYFDPFSLTLPIRKPKKTIVTVHDLIPLIYPELFPIGMKGRIRWEIQKYSLQQCAKIITDSIASKRDIMRLTGVPEAKISVVYLAAGDEFKIMHLSSEQKRNIIQKYNLPKKFALYVGDITANKNVLRLVKVCKDENIPLVLVGKALAQTVYDRLHPWNKELVQVQTLIHDTTHIQTLGFVPTEDVVALYNLATVFVFPSFYEGFGLPVLEAMQSGCPVITTKGGSLPEVAGEAAYYVDSQSVESIRDGIVEMMGNDTLRDDYKKKGIAQAAKFSWKKTAKETLNVYEKIY
ncbi:glycosyltransferase family 1 protein [soil metagenome]